MPKSNQNNTGSSIIRLSKNTVGFTSMPKNLTEPHSSEFQVEQINFIVGRKLLADI